ncbi:MAG: ABC transporter substrate-binding protein [Chloroflexi bacterium]|nr:ABC transporter substrate-binding protein [Chloroflexota bacterium]
MFDAPHAKFTRRRLLGLLGGAASVGLLAACGQPAPAAPAAATQKPAESKPAEAKPTAAAKPGESKPAETKPAASKPAESTPAQQAPAAASGAAPATVGPKETLVYGMAADPTNLDPHATVDGLSIITMHRVYDKLVDLRPGEPKPGAALEVDPEIADSWTISSDSLTYTFKLKPGLKFADGSPLDANAVKWSFDRLMAINKTAASNLRQLKSTEAKDPTTVVMTLAEPYAYFLPSLGTYASAVINPKVMEQAKDNDWAQQYLANNTMGSGPYVLSAWQRAQQITLDYNPNWWGKAPALKRVIIRIVPEATNLKLQLEKGDLDFITGVSIPELLQMQGRPNVRLQEAPSISLSLAYLNCTKPPLDNVKVRQAMSYAINYDAYIQELIQGKGRRLRGPLAYGMEGFDESLKGYDYDQAKAKQLLAEAGHPNGFEITLTYSSQGAAGADDVALATQSDLAAIGIQVKIEKIAEPTRRERIDKGDFVWSVGGWTPPIPIPPWTMEKWYLSANKGLNANRAFYGNPKVDELVKQAPTILDADKRISMYRDAQKIVVDEAPYILFYQANQLLAMRDNLDGFQVKPGGSHFLSYERLSKK